MNGFLHHSNSNTPVSVPQVSTTTELTPGFSRKSAPPGPLTFRHCGGTHREEQCSGFDFSTLIGGATQRLPQTLTIRLQEKTVLEHHRQAPPTGKVLTAVCVNVVSISDLAFVVRSEELLAETYRPPLRVKSRRYFGTRIDAYRPRDVFVLVARLSPLADFLVRRIRVLSLAAPSGGGLCSHQISTSRDGPGRLYSHRLRDRFYDHVADVELRDSINLAEISSKILFCVFDSLDNRVAEGAGRRSVQRNCDQHGVGECDKRVGLEDTGKKYLRKGKGGERWGQDREGWAHGWLCWARGVGLDPG
ncbi:hypothetical protein RRG08_005103 [Elysia crispata]|uniref:Uncharacterized protein n=1 Tax=Elysia crispata TaxID=231223 RepID=A0AAE0YDE5_9GAST|nr:hypothetical protein RRG08_005103 [Elysia crispata]